MKKAIPFLFLLAILQAAGQSKDELAIQKVLNTQIIAGNSGITNARSNTLNNYKNNYPDTASMGKPAFNLPGIKQISPEYFQVTGKWHLQRSIGNTEGYFTLLPKKMVTG